MTQKSKLNSKNWVVDEKCIHNHYEHNYQKLYNSHTSDPARKFLDLTREDTFIKPIQYRKFVDLTREKDNLYQYPPKKSYRCRTQKVLDFLAKILVESEKEKFTSPVHKFESYSYSKHKLDKIVELWIQNFLLSDNSNVVILDALEEIMCSIEIFLQ